MDDEATDGGVDLAAIERAAERIAGEVEATPFLHSRTLSEITGAEIWLKFENRQFTASFKERGALTKLAGLKEDELTRGVIAMSAGNHAQGVAYHAARLGAPATVVMPRHTPFNKVESTRRLGATVVLHGDDVTEAAAHADEIARQHGLTFVHPYDDPAIVAGQGTIALEMLRSNGGLDALVVPIGGGGLISGIATAAKALQPGIRIIGVEAALYPSVSQALRGETGTLGGPTIAEGIAVKQPGKLTLSIIRELVDDIMLVEEADIEHAVLQLLEIEKTVVEGAGAAGLAAVLAHPERFAGQRLGLVLCGGNIDSRLLSAVILRGLVRSQRLVRLRVVVPDQPGQLARMTSLIADAGGNIVEVSHSRAFSGRSVKEAVVDFTIETRDGAHASEIVSALEDAGYTTSERPDRI